MWLTYLLNGGRYNLRYFPDMRTEVSGSISYPSLYSRPACMDDSGLILQACWPGSKALQWLLLPAVLVLIYPNSIPGSTSGYFAGTLTAYKKRALLYHVSNIKHWELNNCKFPGPLLFFAFFYTYFLLVLSLKVPL